MGSPVTATVRPAGTLELRPTGWALLTPAVPQVRELLRYPVVEFGAGGPLGHHMEVVESDWLAPVVTRNRFVAAEGRVDRREVQVIPQGLVPQVAELLHALGHPVEVIDRREDSPRWVRRADWTMHVGRAHRRTVEALGERRTLRVIGYDAERVADTIAGAARAYPDARIAVAVSTYRLLWPLRRRLGARLGERLGLYTAKERTFGRVSVGLIGQLPRGRGEWDLLVLPSAEHTVSDAALGVVTSEQYRRVLAFSRARETGDADLDRRFRVIAGHTFPEETVPVPVAVAVLPARGARPGGMADAFEQKEQLYWFNARRNRRIAAVAEKLLSAKRKTVRALVGGDGPPVEKVVAAAKAGVAVLVETPVHARELAALLPGWAVWTANELEAAKPEPGCGVIATERAAQETVVRAEVLIRATGTRWPLPAIGWPWPEYAASGVLIDFADEFHPLARTNAAERAEGYERSGMTVYAPARTATDDEATGASG